ncbi:MAG TPA: glycosyltransferase [Solirubrobacteraceae bacterium]|nr:glycosyltransferase [Solirubrobacteraceae bacterium]
MDRPVVTVVVPVRNGMRRIDELLGALAAQELDAPYEVIVVDDASTDDTADRVARRDGVRLLRMQRQSGSYAARNRGVQAARGPVLAFTDADCVPTPSWLARGLDALARGADIVGGHVEIPLPERPSVAALVDRLQFLDQERYVAAGFAATANLFVPRALVARIGGFNDRLGSGGDMEFGLRAGAAGATIAYAADVVVMHESRDTVPALVRKAFRIGRGMASHRRVGRGPIRDRPPLALDVRSYLPQRKVVNWQRLEPFRLTRRRRALVMLVEYAAVQFPRALGALVGTLRDG